MMIGEPLYTVLGMIGILLAILGVCFVPVWPSIIRTISEWCHDMIDAFKSFRRKK